MWWIGAGGLLIVFALLAPKLGGWRARSLLVVVAVALVAVGLTIRRPGPPDIRTQLPEVSTVDGYVSSNDCRECHPDQYESWHASYHRTMTQVATPEAVLAPFDVQLESHGVRFDLERRGDEFWATLTDPNASASAGADPSGLPARTEMRIVMTTGSNRTQVFWTPSWGDHGLINLPFSYLVADQAWVPRDASMLSLPRSEPSVQMWSSDCIPCHSTHGRPGYDETTRTVATKVVELGIACEACHGPAERHVRAMRAAGPGELPADADLAIMRLPSGSAKTESQICGQCHSIFMLRDLATMRDWWRNGHPYRPGDDLEATRDILRYSDDPSEPWVRQWLAHQSSSMENIFWSDGMVRVPGREYNSILRNACHLSGDMSCLSCHSMHESDPNDQLARGMDGNDACLKCHADYGDRLEEHTHHRADSSGSLCYNCHMPHTTFGNLYAVRSHEIDSPDVATTLSTGRPNACNQCHLDKSLGWTMQRLHEWYDRPTVELDDEQQSIAASVLWLLRGNALQRILATWSLGWQPAREVSGREWIAPFLVEMLQDPYPAVRLTALRALRTLPDFADIEFEVSWSSERLDALRGRIEKSFERFRSEHARSAGFSVPIDANGVPLRPTTDRLLRQRDHRRMYLFE